MKLFRLWMGVVIVLMPALALGNEKFKDNESEMEPVEMQPTSQRQAPTQVEQISNLNAEEPDPIAGKGQKVFTLGFLVANSLIGGEVEYFLNNAIGIEAGVGIVGAGAGVNLHFYTSRNSDYYFNVEGGYWPVFGFVPAVELGGRSFYGKRKKIGLGAEAGLGFMTTSGSISSGGKTLSWENGQSFLVYSLGLLFNL